MKQIDENDFMNAIRIASAYQEQPIKEWLMEKLGDKYTDDIDTIVFHGSGIGNKVVGKYNMCTSPFIEINKVVVFKRDSFPIQIKPIAPEPSGLIGWQSVS